MPLLNIIRAHARQGVKVRYRVDPSTVALLFTAKMMAFCSACSAREQLPWNHDRNLSPATPHHNYACRREGHCNRY